MALHLPHLPLLPVPLRAWHRSPHAGLRYGSREDLAARLTVATAELVAARAVIDEQTDQLARAANAARLAAAEHASAVTAMRATVAAAARIEAEQRDEPGPSVRVELPAALAAAVLVTPTADPVLHARHWLADRRLMPAPGADPARVLAGDRR